MKNFILIILFIQILFNFTSCENLFFIDESVEKIKEKTTIKTFEHLENPIVVTDNINVDAKFCGLEFLGTKTEMLGVVFTVIDSKTNEIFDWIFYPNTTRVMTFPISIYENSEGEKSYYSIFYDKIVCLNPKKTYLEEFENTVNAGYVFESDSYKGDYIPLISSGYDKNLQKQTYIVNTFDVLKKEVTNKQFSFPTDGIGYMKSPFPAGEDIYFISHNYDDNNYLLKFDLKKNICYEPFAKFSTERIDSNGEKDTDVCSIDVVDENYIICVQNPLGSTINEIEYNIYVYDRKNYDSIKTIKVSNPSYGKAYPYKCLKVDDRFFLILPEEFSSVSHIVEINIENGSTNYVTKINFDFYINLFTIDSKIYFPNYYGDNGFEYGYYDVRTNEVSSLIKLNLNDYLLH